MSPITSVIIPTYNRWPLVVEAVDSVLAQSFQDIEIIVVDDGSTDGTTNRLAKFDGRLRLFTTTRRGVAAARNFGVSQAQGCYVAFLDSDDLWLPGKLETQIAFLDRHPEIQICQTDEIWVRNGVRVNPKAMHRKPSGDIFVRSLDLCLISPSAVMMTRELFQCIGGFDESFPVCEDYDLWLRVTSVYSVPLIPEALVVKRGGHADQLSRSLWGMDRYRVLALQKILRSGLDGVPRTAARDVLRRKVLILAQGARKRGKEQEAQDYEATLAEFTQEKIDVGERDPRLRAGERFS
ncbi:MAG: glycosyltransferase [Deltaproteobacteria bacterium]|nr:MAG: glycosyltransferase [Deltaproteobacteria bacterium]